MQGLLKRFDELPRFFQIAFLVFFLIPIWSTLSLGSPLALARSGQLADWAAVVSYWIGPAAMCLAILLRAHLVIFVFMTECAALLVHTTTSTANGDAPGLAVARAVLIGCVAILGFAFFSRDVSMPFFSSRKRGFRGASRMRTNTSLRISGDKVKDLQAEMEDCSLVGVAFGFGARDGETPPLARGDKIEIAVRLEKTTVTVAGVVEWCIREEMFHRAGFSTTDVTTMAEVIKGASLRTVPAYRAKLAKLMTTSSMARMAIAMWIGCFGGVAAIPACGEAGFSGSAGVKSDKAKANAGGKKDVNNKDDDTGGNGKNSTGGNGGGGKGGSPGGGGGGNPGGGTPGDGGNLGQGGGNGGGNDSDTGSDTNGTKGTIGDSDGEAEGGIDANDDTVDNGITIDDEDGMGGSGSPGSSSDGTKPIVIDDAAGDPNVYVVWSKLTIDADGQAGTGDDTLGVGTAACDSGDLPMQGGGQCFNGAVSASFLDGAADATNAGNRWKLVCNYAATGVSANAARAYVFVQCRKGVTSEVASLRIVRASLDQPDPARPYLVGTAACAATERLVAGGGQCFNGSMSRGFPEGLGKWSSTCNYQTTNVDTNKARAYVFAACVRTSSGHRRASAVLKSLSDTAPLWGVTLGCLSGESMVGGGPRCAGGSFSASTLAKLEDTAAVPNVANGRLPMWGLPAWKTVCNYATSENANGADDAFSALICRK